MSRLIAPTVAVLLVASCSAFGAGTASSSVAGSTELAIDGVSCGRLYSVEGGDPRASAVVVSNPVGTALPKKQIAGITYAPITVEVALPPAQPILDWIGDLCANRKTRKTLLLTEYNVNGQVTGTPLQAINALLTEVRFPAFDAASKDAARLTLVFTPESTKATTVAAAMSAGAANKVVLLANFRIQIGNLPANKVSRIEPFTITQSFAANVVGEVRNATAELPAPAFSNLILTLNSSDIADWNTWRDNFVVKGISDDASEKSGSLELLAPDMTTLFTLQFSHVGIVRASPMRETSSDAIRKFQAELYCESMAIGTAPAKPLTLLPVAPSTATMAAPAPTTTAVSSAAGSASDSSGKASADAASGGATQASLPGTESSATAPSSGGVEKAGADAASGGGAAAQTTATPTTMTPTAPLAASRATGLTPVAGLAPLLSPTTATTPAVTNAADQGARDPVNFPRPDGTVRKSYSSVRQKTYLQEIVAYSSKDTLDAIEEFYTKSLTAAGWELNRRFENNSGVGNAHQIIINWTNTLRSVAVTLTDVKGGGAEIGVNLTTTFAP